MAYSSNILSTEAAYYTLLDTTIENGIMRLSEGGSAICDVTGIAKLTETFRVSLLPQTPTDNYVPKAYVKVNATTVDKEVFSYTLIPSGNEGEVINFELPMTDKEFTEFTFAVYAVEPFTLQLWELCPLVVEDVSQKVIDSVSQSIPKLLYDYNMLPLVVQQVESTIGLITFNLHSATDLGGHFTLTCVASEYCTLTIRFYDTYTQELYSPMYFDLLAGRNTIGIPHAYLKRDAGFHTTYVTAQVSSGTLSIGTRGLLYTIDGGYLASRTIDVGIDTTDITMHKDTDSYVPDYIYAIGIDSGEALVRRRYYGADTSVAFEPLYSIGPAKYAAIEFNGSWEVNLDDNETLYSIVTDDEPFIFFIDNANNLIVQYGANEDTRLTLDTNVSTVSACRGYNSVVVPENDQGLVCLYVKNGTAYYYTYAYDITSREVLWQGPFAVNQVPGTVVSAYVHRLNDYRLSFVINTTTANYWLVTERTYVTQAVPLESLRVSYSEAVGLVSMSVSDEPYPTEPAVLGESVSGKTITVTFNKPTRFMTSNAKELFSVANNNIESIEVNDTTMTIVVTNDLPATVSITYNRTSNMWQFQHDGSWYPMVARTFVIATFEDTEEHVALQYSAATASVSILSTGVAHNAYTDTVSIDYADASSAVSIHKLSTIYKTISDETVVVSYSDASGDVEITQTGVKPI